MDPNEGAVFEPETIDLMRSALDAVWASLSADRQAKVSRAFMAQRILKAVTQGERDPARLRACALFRLVRPELKAG
jgi:hypothetical protein